MNDIERQQMTGIVTQSGAGIGNNSMSPEGAVSRQPEPVSISMGASYLQKNHGGSAGTVQSLKRK